MDETIRLTDIYEEILHGKRDRFPLGTFTDMDNCVRLIKYMIEEKLQWSDEDIKEKLKIKTFKQWKLLGMLTNVFKVSPYKALNVAYPNKFKPWELSTAPQGFWNLETGIEATKWMIEEKLKWSFDDIKEKLRQEVFEQFGLLGMLQTVFGSSPFKAISAVYPDILKPWDLANSPKNTWTAETAVDILRWIIEEKLGWTKEDILNKLSKRTFEENDLGPFLSAIYNNSPYKAINALYPGLIKPWELKTAPNSVWNQESGKEAMKWLIEDKLQWSHDDIKKKLDTELFKQYGLYGMLQIVYLGSPYKAVNALYPGNFWPWELQSSPQNTWGVEVSRQAIKWMIEEKLMWTPDEARQKLKEHHFQQYGVLTPLHKTYGSSVSRALSDVYPSLAHKRRT